MFAPRRTGSLVDRRSNVIAAQLRDPAGLGKHFAGKRIFGEANADYGGGVHAYGALVKALGPQLSVKSVNAPLSNLPGFAEAFSCPAGAPMVRSAADRCTVW